MTSANRACYVVQTQPHCENKAMIHLARQGFGAYLPRYLKRRRHARRIEIVPAPLFPRYLFVEIDIGAQRWRSIYSTVGVSVLFAPARPHCRSINKFSPLSESARTRLGSSGSRAARDFASGKRFQKFWLVSFADISDFMKECRIATASASCSICFSAKCAS